MFSRLLAVGLVSLALACTIALVFYKVFGAAGGHSTKMETRNVVVATADLPMGSQIRPEDIRLAAVPRELAPHNSLEKIDDVKDRVVTNAIMKGEPVAASRLAAPGSGPGLAPMIPAGYRAVSVRVNDVIGVAGFIQPGMRVDVLASGRLPNVDDSVTRTVLQNVVVLSAGQVLQPEPKGQVINAQVVTLQVRPEEAEILTLTSGEGRIQLVLRNSSDTRIEQTPGARLTAVYGMGDHAVRKTVSHSPEKVPEPEPPKPPASTAPVISAPRQRTVEVIRGTARSDVPLGDRTELPGTKKLTCSVGFSLNSRTSGVRNPGATSVSWVRSCSPAAHNLGASSGVRRLYAPFLMA